VFDGGVMIAADMLGSYGSLAKFRDCPRVMKVNETTILGAGGDYADYQFLHDIIEQKVIDEDCLDDGFHIKPKSLYCWLTRVLYNRRSKFDPLWTTFLVGGLQDGEPFLGHVDKLGTAFEAPHIATGYGAYIALPMMRDAYEKNPKLSKAQAEEVLTRCLRVLFYRDARSFNKYQIVTVTKDGSSIEGPRLLTDLKWEVGLLNEGYE
jgi:20S proteasome subunit beta 7